MSRLFAFVTCLFIIASANAQINYRSCVTPNRAYGLCQPIRMCQSAIRLLTPPISYEVREFLRQSQCYFDTQPWVCCPDSVTQATTKVPTHVTGAPTRPTINNTPTLSPGAGGSKLPNAPNCGIASPNRIFGGEQTLIDEYPWLAQLQYNKPGNKQGFHCGGSLINTKYVLTAAHCVSKVPVEWKLTSVRLGEWDTSTNPDCDNSLANENVCNLPHVDVPVEEKIVHEDYQANSKNQHHDIALLRLSRSVSYSEFIKPVCLPVGSDLRNKDLSGLSLTVAGWGKTETTSSSTKKLKVDIYCYSNSKCQEVYTRSNNQIIDGQICAGGDPGRDSCNGDSGGPLMRYHEQGNIPHFFLAGVVSYGPKNCGTPDVPGVYTRVSTYIDWIQRKIRD